MESKPITIERIFDAPIAKVWDALTNPNEMKLWYFDLPGFKAEVGYKFQFTGGQEDGIQYLHLCEVTEIIESKRLTYSWRYDGYAGNSFVTFDLSDENGKTRLNFSHSGIETFPEDNPDLAKKNFVTGWDHIINISLKDYLEK
jgi:uncharacterized protein YndB with AHSA1/START domain